MSATYGTTRQVTVRKIGNGGVEDLSCHINDAEMSWALLRCVTGQGASSREKLVAIACHGADMTAAEHQQMLPFSSHVLQLLGTADVSLSIKRSQDLARELATALVHSHSADEPVKPPTEDHTTKPSSCDSAEQALRAVANELSPCNWVLLEPTKLELHGTGSGGLNQFKESLSADKVLFGVLRFTFPRDDSAPAIVKYLFIHWIGPEVSVVRRGQWNSKLEKAVLKMRNCCEFAFRKTAYMLEDLTLPQLIEELGRVTCVTSSDTRQFSMEWYLESLCASGPEMPAQINSVHIEESQSNFKALLRESAEHAVKIVREQGRQWTWVLLTAAECRGVSSGGA